MANPSTTFLVKQSKRSDSYEFANKQEFELWNAFRNGDKSAFAYIYIRFFPVLYRYGCRLCKDKQLVQDCIQDLFIELSKSPEKLSQTTSIRYYLYRCMRRKISLKMSALYQHRLEPLDGNEHEGFREGGILPIEFQDIEIESAGEQRLEILRALQFLTKKQRKVIQLRFFEDMSCREISAALSININTVYNLISLATNSLKRIIGRLPLLAVMLADFIF
jgi:RNA polymerase sigma factor (sigma-70 family)